MNITLLPQVLTQTQIQQNKTTSNYGKSLLTPLSNDTVSFCANPSSSYTIKDKISYNYDEEIKSQEFKDDATSYLKSLNNVVTKLSKKGYSWNKEEAVKHIIKSLDAYLSKIGRSGSLVVPDKIRATVYNTNVRNLSSLVNDLLPAMEDEGYVLASTKMSVKDLMKRGYIPTDKEKAHPNMMKEVKDLDIRLKDVMDQLSVLPENLRYCIGKPQDSGYEDIQMRFIKKKDIGKKNPRTFELLVLSGPSMEEAKLDESKFVYSNTRKFKPLAERFANAKVNSDEYRIINYISLVKGMFESNVSKKLFANAKNKQENNGLDELPIYFSEKDKQLIDGCFNGIRFRLSRIHSADLKQAKDDPEKAKELNKIYRADRALINDIETSLNATIEHYNLINEISD